jgi:hypothetical protein
MRLDPLRVVYVQPAPKSRCVVFGPFAFEDQKHLKSRSEAEQKQSKSRAKAEQKLPG